MREHTAELQTRCEAAVIARFAGNSRCDLPANSLCHSNWIDEHTLCSGPSSHTRPPDTIGRHMQRSNVLQSLQLPFSLACSLVIYSNLIVPTHTSEVRHAQLTASRWPFVQRHTRFIVREFCRRSTLWYAGAGFTVVSELHTDTRAGGGSFLSQ